MTLITYRWDPNGVLANATSVKFSDPTATYGLRRADNQVVIVADNTSLTNVGTGLYEYTVTDPPGEPDYDYWIEVVDGPNTFRTRYFTADDEEDGVGESSLSVARNDLKRAIGRYLSVNRDYTQWGTTLQQDVDDVIKSAERMFYKCRQLPGEDSIHVWSFLQPEFSLELGDEEEDHDLPADFGGFVNRTLYFAADDNNWLPLREVPVSAIKSKRQLDEVSSSNQSLLYAVNIKAYDQSTGTRQKLMVWPMAGGTVKATYYSIPDAISDADPYPLGGQQHAETLRAAALAAAELEINGERGVHWMKFEECMRDSIALDRKLSCPSYFGTTNVSAHGAHLWGRHQNHDLVSYNDVFYTG